jgi:transcriptional regulator with XRE-family HTH domain
MDYTTYRQLLGQRVRKLREEDGMTQEKLAELVDKTTEHVSYIERGLRSPSFEMLIDLATVFGVSLPYLLDIVPLEQKIMGNFPAPIPPSPIPESVQEPVKSKDQRKSDLERLNECLEKIRPMQQLANEYEIPDIFQDNGGKVLQLLILLGLKQSRGREGNDAVDEDGNEYELKTINHSINPNAGITTHHHLTKEIINKYRGVSWYIGIYEGIELLEIWKVHPSKLEDLFVSWENWIDIHHGQARNNPKIPLRYVRMGEIVYRNPNKLSRLSPRTIFNPDYTLE